MWGVPAEMQSPGQKPRILPPAPAPTGGSFNLPDRENVRLGMSYDKLNHPEIPRMPSPQPMVRDARKNAATAGGPAEATRQLETKAWNLEEDNGVEADEAPVVIRKEPIMHGPYTFNTASVTGSLRSPPRQPRYYDYTRGQFIDYTIAVPQTSSKSSPSFEARALNKSPPTESQNDDAREQFANSLPAPPSASPRMGGPLTPPTSPMLKSDLRNGSPAKIGGDATEDRRQILDFSFRGAHRPLQHGYHPHASSLRSQEDAQMAVQTASAASRPAAEMARLGQVHDVNGYIEECRRERDAQLDSLQGPAYVGVANASASEPRLESGCPSSRTHSDRCGTARERGVAGREEDEEKAVLAERVGYLEYLLEETCRESKTSLQQAHLSIRNLSKTLQEKEEDLLQVYEDERMILNEKAVTEAELKEVHGRSSLLESAVSNRDVELNRSREELASAQERLNAAEAEKSELFTHLSVLRDSQKRNSSVETIAKLEEAASQNKAAWESAAAWRARSHAIEEEKLLLQEKAQEHSLASTEAQMRVMKLVDEQSELALACEQRKKESVILIGKLDAFNTLRQELLEAIDLVEAFMAGGDPRIMDPFLRS